MGLFDIFNSNVAEEAAAKQKAGLDAGYAKASDALGQGRTALTTNYTAGLQPFIQNFQTAQGGQNAYADATGAAGPEGAARARAAFMADPGYNYRIEQGNENVLRNASRTGSVASGGTNVDLLKLGQGEAAQGWQQYISNLLPFLNKADTAAGGIGQMYAGLGGGLNQNFGSLAQLGYQTETGKGNADANATLDQNRANSQIWNTGMQAASMAATVF